MEERKKDNPTNTKSVTYMLALESAKVNKSRNQVLLGAIILSIISVTIVFGIFDKKIQEEYIQAVRQAGMAATAYLERGNQEQYERIKELTYIRQAGRSFPLGNAYDGRSRFVSQMSILDQNAWQRLFRPAYGEIHGTYPTAEDEIMLSKRALENMNLSDSEIGTEINLTVDVGLFRKETGKFRLCGWFTDYTELSGNPAIGYLSEKKLQEWNLDFRGNADILIRQKDGVTWQELEQRIYEDIPIEKTQNFAASDSYIYEAVNHFAGGYGMAAAGVMIILAGVYLLVSNVMRLSMINDIRQMGLLNMLGATGKQIRHIYGEQISWILLKGSLAGGIVSIVLSMIIGIRLCVLLFAIVFTAGVTGTAALGIIRKMVRTSCVETLHYTGTSNRQLQKERKIQRRKRSQLQELVYMAWQNIFRNKKRNSITICSLFLGMTAAFGAMVIIEGSDPIHYYKERPDFIIFGEMCSWAQQEGYGNEYKENELEADMLKTEASSIALISDNYYEEFSPIPEGMSEDILNLEGVNKKQSYVLEGAYMIPVFTGKGVRPIVDEESYDGKNTMQLEADCGIVQILREEDISRLSKYAEEKRLPVDMDSLQNGTGLLLLHDHALSPEQETNVAESVGESLFFKSFATKKYMEALENISGEEREDFEKNWDGQISGEFRLCGYMDTADNQFPAIRQTWHGREILYFVISEEGFEKLPTDRKTFYMEINTDMEKESQVDHAIQKILLKENHIRQENEESGIAYVSKSVLLAREEKTLQGNRLILGCISIILIFVGLMNYFNVTITGILSREKEFSVMRSIGMTSQQQRILLIMEGACYCMITVGLFLTLGSGILWIIRTYMEARVLYFHYIYPINIVLFLAGCLCGICIVVPLVICRKLEKE